MIDLDRSVLDFKARDSVLLRNSEHQHGINRVAHEAWSSRMRVGVYGAIRPAVFFITAGIAHHHRPDGYQRLLPGMAFSHGVLGPSQVISDQQRPVTVYALEWDPASIQATWEVRFGRGPWAIMVTNPKRWTNAFTDILSEAHSQDRWASAAITALATTLFIELTRSHPLATEPDPGLQHALRAQRILTAEVENGITIADVAQRIGISPAHLSRIFRQHIGQTPRQWFLGKRMERAQTLVRAQPSLPLRVIAHRLGYADPYALSKAYKQYYGFAPRGALTR